MVSCCCLALAFALAHWRAALDVFFGPAGSPPEPVGDCDLGRLPLRTTLPVYRWPNIWVTSMLRLFRPQIVELVRKRDAAVANWRKKHPDVDAFEDRGCDITSDRKISVEAQIKRVDQALTTVAT